MDAETRKAISRLGNRLENSLYLLREDLKVIKNENKKLKKKIKKFINSHSNSQNF